MHHVKLLNEFGLKATPQRLCVLNILSYHTHPSIDELHEEVLKNYPSVSLATVYKNLSAMIDKGIVVEIAIPNKKSRFDILEKPHIHVVCEKCGNIIDFDDKSSLSEYRNSIEDKIGDKVAKLNIVATIKSCSCCKK